VLLALVAGAWALPSAAAGFPQGVASGDVTPTSAVLWTRTDAEADLTVEVSTDPVFQAPGLLRTARAAAESDFTVKLLVEPLDPGRTYFYRFRDGVSHSETGVFKTAPPRSATAGVRFAFSGDSDAGVNQFEALEAARREGLDFFVYLGDTIYADSPHRGPLGPAQTLEQYREAYKINRQYPALRELLRSTSTYAIWDDHEVRDDFAGLAVDPLLYANGRRAFLEFLPLGPLLLPDPRACPADPLFRFFHWGKDIDIIILDERTCRSPSAQRACSTSGQPDLAPALPALFRLTAGQTPAPPPGCLEALSDPARTMLGPFQKLVFKAALLYSRARFKFVINQVAIQQFYGLPYDRWEGYAAERNEILNFIREHRLRNVIFLTADAHANFMNHVYVDRFRDPEPIAYEFVTGPIATRTLGRDLELASPEALVAINAILDLIGMECRHLDAYSYGLVEVDPQASSAAITLKDDQGRPLRSQNNPAVTCAKSFE